MLFAQLVVSAAYGIAVLVAGGQTRDQGRSHHQCYKEVFSFHDLKILSVRIVKVLFFRFALFI